MVWPMVLHTILILLVVCGLLALRFAAVLCILALALLAMRVHARYRRWLAGRGAGATRSFWMSDR